MPFNFWTISLFLWIFKNDLKGNFQNDVELINLYMEKLLEKETLVSTDTSFGFDKYKKYLAFLAHFLVKNHSENGYSATYEELIDFTSLYLRKNIRYTITAKEILDYIEDKNIIRKKHNNRYTFRLNGIIEYFIAVYMTYDQDFLYDAISDDNLYLSFSNEFELYAGFRRSDSKFMNRVFDRTKVIFEPLNELYNLNESSIDHLLKSKITRLNELIPLIDSMSDKLINGLSDETKDEIEEEMINELSGTNSVQSEVKVKSICPIENTVESLEKSLFILGKVFKNIDELEENTSVEEIFDFILDNVCYWGFKVIDEVKNEELTDLLKSEHSSDAKKLLQMLTSIIPTLVQVRLNDMIGNKNLESIIISKLDKLKKDYKNNQYQLFILNYLLIDIDLRKHKNKIDDVLELISLPILRFSSLIKLNYYLGFKINQEDKELIQFFQKKLQSQKLLHEKETDLGSLHKSMSNTNKNRLNRPR